MIYTSYFALLRRMPKHITPVSISLYTPRWYTGFEYKQLAPTTDIFWNYEKTKDEEMYTYYFKNNILKCLTPKDVVDKLMAMSSTPDIALLCYERPTDFCHRRLVSEWLRNNGFESEEWKG